MTGPEMAALVKIGTRLVRGEDWKWADQVRVTGVKGYLETGPKDSICTDFASNMFLSIILGRLCWPIFFRDLVKIAIYFLCLSY